MKKTSVYFILSLLFCAQSLSAQTSWSLFWRTDSVQVNRIEAFDNKQYRKVGHHGPAVENSFMALRIYFNDSGAIDVYSKRGPAMELRKYLWYPSEKQQKEENAGCDEYFVGKTVGLGGIKLWDGENEVAVAIGSKRVANAGDTAKGSFAEVITYGVPYKECTVDISLRIDMFSDSRIAQITASCISGDSVQFVTGVNYNDGAKVDIVPGSICVWGTHPANVSQSPIPIGGGMWYEVELFGEAQMHNNMVRIISKPAMQIQTKVVSASAKESEINTYESFKKLMASQVQFL